MSIIDKNITAFAVSGGAGFAAAKFVFDASTTKAIIVGVVVGSIALALLSIPTNQLVNNQ